MFFQCASCVLRVCYECASCVLRVCCGSTHAAQQRSSGLMFPEHQAPMFRSKSLCIDMKLNVCKQYGSILEFERRESPPTPTLYSPTPPENDDESFVLRKHQESQNPLRHSTGTVSRRQGRLSCLASTSHTSWLDGSGWFNSWGAACSGARRVRLLANEYLPACRSNSAVLRCVQPSCIC